VETTWQVVVSTRSNPATADCTHAPARRSRGLRNRCEAPVDGLDRAQKPNFFAGTQRQHHRSKKNGVPAPHKDRSTRADFNVEEHAALAAGGMPIDRPVRIAILRGVPVRRWRKRQCAGRGRKRGLNFGNVNARWRLASRYAEASQLSFVTKFSSTNLLTEGQP
jgi:hypothetical protein